MPVVDITLHWIIQWQLYRHPEARVSAGVCVGMTQMIKVLPCFMCIWPLHTQKKGTPAWKYGGAARTCICINCSLYSWNDPSVLKQVVGKVICGFLVRIKSSLLQHLGDVTLLCICCSSERLNTSFSCMGLFVFYSASILWQEYGFPVAVTLFANIYG